MPLPISTDMDIAFSRLRQEARQLATAVDGLSTKRVDDETMVAEVVALAADIQFWAAALDTALTEPEG